MCGRYLTPEEADLERAFDLNAPDDYFQSFNLAPSQIAPVIRSDASEGRKLEMLTWGFQPHWAKRGWINARSETLFTSRAFASAGRRSRCLVPALGWYEWQGAKAPKQPWLFHLDGFRPFAFAGIWTRGGDDRQDNFAILTTDAAPSIAAIHNRMPVIVQETDFGRWLAEDCDQDEAGAIIRNHLTNVSFYKVAPYVNKPANNDAACITPQE